MPTSDFIFISQKKFSFSVLLYTGQLTELIFASVAFSNEYSYSDLLVVVLYGSQNTILFTFCYIYNK
jgi:hypothetical protein